MCEDFSVGSLTNDEFKSIMFVVTLKNRSFSDIVSHLLLKLESADKSQLNLDYMTNEFKRVVSLKKDTHSVETDDSHTVKYIIRREIAK